jgi:diguanylate cyclase (GGDEF)-like protein/PAS domain S-box-containing protein
VVRLSEGNLRQKAEELLGADGHRVENLGRVELASLAHELAVHQIELEIQNEELRRSQAEVETARDRYTDLYDFAPVAYFTLGQHNAVVEANLTAADLLGVVRSKLPGTRFTRYVTPDNTDAFYFWRRKTLETETKETCELEMAKADGTRFYAHLEGIAKADKQFRIAVMDITERKKAESIMEESHRRLTEVLESISDGFFTLEGNNLKVTYFNTAAERLLGRKGEELLGRNFVEAFPEAKGTIFEEKYNQARKTEQPVAFETCFGIKPCENWYDVRVYPYENGIAVYFQVTTERKRAEKVLGQHVRELTMLNEAAKSLSESTRLNTVLKIALDTVIECTELHLGILYLFDKPDGELVLSIRKGVSDEFAEALHRIPLGVSITGKVAETRQVLATSDATQDGRVADNHKPHFESEKIRCFVGVPLKSGGRIVGVISAGAHSPRNISGAEIRLLETLGSQIGVAIDHAQLLEKMSRLSITDELTGLYNRRRFCEVLDTEIDRSQRYGHCFCVVMMDIDGFKKYNDKFGHTSGDRLLKAFAEKLKPGIRSSDLACRYGGDEFAIILLKADAEKAIKAVDRTRSMFVQILNLEYGLAECQLGLSAGIAEFPGSNGTAAGLIFLADCALYQAKQQGGNKSVVASDLRILPDKELSITTIEEVTALAATVDARDPLTYGHSNRVANISEIIGKAIGMPEKELIELHSAAVLHDIGKLGIPDSILTKPGKPTKREWEVLKGHSGNGAKIVAHIKDLAVLVPMILHHHEWYDGTGYPDELKGENIPLGARIISIADAYDTMTTSRPYRNLLSKEEALEELERCSGRQFDPKLVALFCRAKK